MGRKFVSIAVVVVFIISLIVFYNYSGSEVKRASILSKDDARITMERFSYRKYSGDRSEIQISSNSGKIMGDSRIMLSGNVKAIKKQADSQETIKSHTAVAYFSGSSLMTDSNEAELEKIIFEKNVVIEFNGYTINTESADYKAS